MSQRCAPIPCHSSSSTASYTRRITRITPGFHSTHPSHESHSDRCCRVRCYRSAEGLFSKREGEMAADFALAVQQLQPVALLEPSPQHSPRAADSAMRSSVEALVPATRHWVPCKSSGLSAGLRVAGQHDGGACSSRARRRERRSG